MAELRRHQRRFPRHCHPQQLHERSSAGGDIAPENWNRHFAVTPAWVQLAFDRWRKLKGYKSVPEENLEFVILYIERAFAADDERQAAQRTRSSPSLHQAEARWRLALHDIQYSLMHLFRCDAFCMGAERISDRLRLVHLIEAYEDAEPYQGGDIHDIGHFAKLNQNLLDQVEEEKLRAALISLMQGVESYRRFPINAPERGYLRIRLALYEALITALRLQVLPLGEQFH